MNTSRLLIFALVVSTSGCARLVPGVSMSLVGIADPEQERRYESLMRDAIKADVPGHKEVVVLVNSVPQGVHLDAGNVVVEPGFQHQVIGKVAIEARSGNFYFIARFLDYRELWRKILCYWQVPLEWVTLGFWSISPTTYACFAGAPLLTREDAIDDLKNAAVAVGADMVIMTYGKDVKEKMRNAEAWLIKRDPNALTH